MAKQEPWHKRAARAFGSIVKTSKSETHATSREHPKHLVVFANWTTESPGRRKQHFKVAQVVVRGAKTYGSDIIVKRDGTFILPARQTNLGSTHTLLPITRVRELSQMAKVIQAAHKALLQHAK
ncbi:MAG: hypothetical protein V1722_03745 [Candidatus Micrarchaeota archaeon]